jgi:hypothetical protein
MAQERLAQKLRTAAARIYEPGSDIESSREISAVSAVGAHANAALNKAADYIEQVDARAIQKDLTTQVQRNPGASLLVAGTAGFILSAMLRRR